MAVLEFWGILKPGYLTGIESGNQALEYTIYNFDKFESSRSLSLNVISQKVSAG